MKITLDTNILVSGTFWEGDAFQILSLIDQKKAECFLSKEILEEYNKVIHSEEIIEKITEKHLMVKTAIIKIIGMCDIVEPSRRIYAVKEDPDDNKILECAIEAKADYVISYDQHLLKLKEFEGIKIISPKDFLAMIK